MGLGEASLVTAYNAEKVNASDLIYR